MNVDIFDYLPLVLLLFFSSVPALDLLPILPGSCPALGVCVGKVSHFENYRICSPVSRIFGSKKSCESIGATYVKNFLQPQITDLPCFDAIAVL